MDWWILELITFVVLVAILAILGPLIKRFGKSYAADVFRANPRTGKSYLVLMDFAYYLIFGAYILFTVQWEPDSGWADTVNAEQLQASAVRVGRFSSSSAWCFSRFRYGRRTHPVFSGEWERPRWSSFVHTLWGLRASSAFPCESPAIFSLDFSCSDPPSS